MEFDQIIKRLDWLDEEHRKDKAALDAMTERLERTEGDLKAANKKIKELTTGLSSLSTISPRIEQFDGALSQQRTELLKYVDDLEKKRPGQQQEIEKRYQIQFEDLNKSIAELRKVKEPIAELKREIKILATEDARLSKATAEWGTRLDAIPKSIEEVRHAQKLYEDAHRPDGKRMADLQGEVSATRKRLDEVREKGDLLADSIRRVETRLNELLVSEAERRQAQTNFIESQALAQVERDRTWKELEEHLGTLRKETDTMNHHLQEWDVAQRAVKRAQETYEDIVQKFERRINEISEMQRLAEDRFRQEWVTFKADDQKRWTSFSLTQDESHKDTLAIVEKTEGRLTAIEDLAQTQQDVIQQTKDANEQLFQGMLAQIHELLSAYERIMGTK